MCYRCVLNQEKLSDLQEIYYNEDLEERREKTTEEKIEKYSEIIDNAKNRSKGE